MDDLKMKLLKYRELTDNMISSINEEKEEEFQKLVIEKQLLINEMNGEKFDSAIFKQIADDLRLSEQDQNLHKVIQEKKILLREEIRQTEDKINAAKAYSNNFIGYNLINKKI